MIVKPNQYGADWQALRGFIDKRIARAHEELEAVDVTIKRAEQLRGQIEGYRAIISYVEPTPGPEVKEPQYYG